MFSTLSVCAPDADADVWADYAVHAEDTWSDADEDARDTWTDEDEDELEDNEDALDEYYESRWEM